MKLEEIKERLPNLAQMTQYDPVHYLREQPIDPEEFQAAVEEAKIYLRQVMQEPKLDPEVLVFLYSYIGNGYRVLNQAQKAIVYLKKALDLTRQEGDQRGEVRTLIRLGEAYRYNQQHEKALECFEQSLTLSRSAELSQYKDFALQHMGKCLLELGEFDHALVRFEEALDLRKKKGDQELILSTETAIVLTHILRQQKEEHAATGVPDQEKD
jgi:tetratricopeptide (TPR) repeat protein